MMGFIRKMGIFGALVLLSLGLALAWIGEERTDPTRKQDANFSSAQPSSANPQPPPARARMEKVRFLEKVADRKTWELEADSAEIDPAKDVITLEEIQTSFYPQEKSQPTKLPDRKGNSTEARLRAKSGRINRKTKEMEVAGDVELIRGDGISITTETLKWNDGKREIRTNDPVKIRSNGMEIEGTGMVSRVDDSSIKVEGPVKARLYR